MCRLEWTAPADGNYAVRVRDLQHGTAGGAAFIYRLRIMEAEPDFALRVASDNLNLLPGETIELEVFAERQGGFQGPIELQFEGLPAEVRVENARIPEREAVARVKLTASDEARAGSSTVILSGQATLADAVIRRMAHAPHLGVDSDGVALGSPVIPRWHLTIAHPPVFRLYCSEAYQYAHRGTIYPYLMDVERMNGFAGEVVLQLGDRQNRDLDGIQMIETTVAPGQSQVMMPIYLPETMHINVQSQSQLYTQGYAIFTDQHGQEVAVLVLAEKRNLIRTLPPVVKLESRDSQLSAAPGETIVCRLHLERTSNFLDAMELRLVEPDSMITADPLRLAPGQQEAEVRIHIGQDAASETPLALQFRATGQMHGGAQVVTEATSYLQLQR
jgi:hypothetical protein